VPARAMIRNLSARTPLEKIKIDEGAKCDHIAIVCGRFIRYYTCKSPLLGAKKEEDLQTEYHQG
jgi:predicted ThiF/HesA family dinucleotide-utilizing enzyme